MSTVNSAERAGRWARLRRTALAAVGTVALAGAAQLWGLAPAGASPSMQSTGSSFASVAIQQWVGQSSTLYGLNINWQVSSSVIGLNNFAQNQVDFAASDIPYSAQQSTYYPNIPYQYLPDVAGGLAFMYNVNGVDGQRITSLVLDAQAIDGIFLGEITKWNSSEIAALNPQLAGDLPATSIIPVYRSDASGDNYLLSDYLLHEDGGDFTAAQNAFQSGSPGQPSATWPIPSATSNFNPQTYPNWATQSLVGESGADNAADYVSALSSVGSITFVETAYAIEHNFPVASVVNASGNAVQPTSVDVATAMEAAILAPDLTQNLTNVYTNPLPDAYPVSAYSYLVTPCSPSLATAQGSSCAADPGGAPSGFPADKGQALGQFAAYIACAGQQQMAELGYSPLPPNLVQEDFNAIGRLNGGVQPPPPTAANCKNPYVDGQTHLLGEPVIVGQAGGGIGGTGTTVAAAAGGAVGGAAGAAGAGGAGASTAAGASGTAGGASSAGSGSAAVAVPKGYALINGHLVRVGQSGPTKFQRADALVAETRLVGGPHSAEVIGWTLLVLAVIIVPPVIALWRRRVAVDADGEPADPSPEREP